MNFDNDILYIGCVPYESGGGGGGSDRRAKYLGTVYPNDLFPRNRIDGSDLVDGDYVKPASIAVFPFTIEGVTFSSKLDKAIYVLSSNSWIVDPGAVQDTSEIPVADKTIESITQQAITQKQINIENVNNNKQKEFIFNVPANVWNIEHLLNKYPSIKLFDNNNNEISATIVYTTLNNIRVEFNIATSGKAIVN